MATISSPSASPTLEMSRRERLILTACMFLITAVFGFLQPFVPLYLEAAQLSRSELGLVMGVGTGLALLIQPLLGRLSDHLDARRPLMVVTALLSGLAYEGYRYAQGWPAFLVLTALGMDGLIYLNAAAAVLIGRLVRRGRHGGAVYAGFRLWGSVGYIVVALATGWLLNPQALRGASRSALDTLFLYGPVLFVPLALAAALSPDRKQAMEPEPTMEAQSQPDRSDEATREVNLRWFLAAYFLYILALYGASTYLSPYLRDLGASPRWITGAFVAGVVCEVMVMRHAGRLSDLWGRRPLLAVSFLLLPLRLLLYIPATGPLWVLCVQMLHGINFGIMGSVAIVFVNDMAKGEEQGRAQARLAASGGLATAIGPALCGAIAQRMGIDWMFGIMAGIGAVSALLFFSQVHETHTGAQSLVEAGGNRFQRLWRLLEAPPRRR